MQTREEISGQLAGITEEDSGYQDQASSGGGSNARGGAGGRRPSRGAEQEVKEAMLEQQWGKKPSKSGSQLVVALQGREA